MTQREPKFQFPELITVHAVVSVCSLYDGGRVGGRVNLQKCQGQLASPTMKTTTKRDLVSNHTESELMSKDVLQSHIFRINHLEGKDQPVSGEAADVHTSK